MTTRRIAGSGASLSVLFVCTANICRSPLAALHLAKLLGAAYPGSRNDSQVEVDVFSRGVLARHGSGMDPTMAEIAMDLGLGPWGHVSAPLTVEDLERADLVVCMERRHTPYVTELRPRAVQSTVTLRTLGALASAEMPDDVVRLRDPRERAGWLLSMRGMVPTGREPADTDVPDPYRRSLETYNRSVEMITSSVERIAHALTRSA